MKAIIGRHAELRDIKRLIDSTGSKMGVVYGRRRIGKSFLIEHCVKEYRSYIFEALENHSKPEQIKHFIFQLKTYFNDSSNDLGVKTWKEAFLLLYNLIKKNKTNVIVFDEFQWMSNYRSEIVAELKFVWDRYLSKLENTNIILCGSIASYMIKKVLRSKALYGRIDMELHLKGFLIQDTCEMLHPKKTEECVEAQLLTGGVPKYLELLNEHDSIRLAIKETAFKQNSYFAMEFERIFISHFGSNAEYRQIVELLTQSPYGLFRKAIADKLNIKTGGYLSDCLYNLEKAGFISTYIPFDKSLNTKYKKYFVSDSYIRFYYSFILPNRKKIESNLSDKLFIEISQTSKYYAWLGKAFEYFCFQHAKLIAEKLGFSAVDYTYGPYFKTRNFESREKGFQIDLLFDRADNVISLCEIKYTNKTIGVDIINEVEKKVEGLETVSRKKTIQRVLISKTDPSKELLNKAYFYKILTLDQLMAERR